MAATADLTSALDLATGTVPLQVRHAVNLSSGTGAGQADKVFSDRRTLAASATEDLDLAGVLLDAFGAAITFARIKGLVIKAAAGNTNNVVIGAAATNTWATLLGATHTITLRPGAALCVMAGATDATGYAVTAGSGDLLKVANSAGGTSVTYDIVLIGASA
ncbi:hypothetical protein HHX38_08385 [Streptomyces sp. PKU-MA01144]|uniref:hypothetical protein n=1 Tax=Streptomyces sp. PKU-MA01144 TaxID=2729138 RepID=UPI00147DEB6C|nr:hypothetical protein [Streptomyces sp. PKU-MA01144]NNJ04151.1 hypothetical protein [Streptomyces sp. PKU-MA01144]